MKQPQSTCSICCNGYVKKVCKACRADPANADWFDGSAELEVAAPKGDVLELESAQYRPRHGRVHGDPLRREIARAGCGDAELYEPKRRDIPAFEHHAALIFARDRTVSAAAIARATGCTPKHAGRLLEKWRGDADAKAQLVADIARALKTKVRNRNAAQKSLVDQVERYRVVEAELLGAENEARETRTRRAS